MINKLNFLSVFFLLVLSQIVYGQDNKGKAFEKGKKAIELMDNGKVDESIKLLEEAQKLDPENLNYPYEIAYANYLKQNYKESIKILEKLTNHKDVNDRVFQLLGNSYDYTGNSEKALDTYDKGLKKFSKSGILYLEKGNVYWSKKDYETAINFYEKGIDVAPNFPSNYYRAALLYCNSTEEVWGMIYGEIFMNLERNSSRTAEISKLLFDTYKSQIDITSDTSFSVSFSQNATINANDLKNATDFNLPYGIGVYEPTLMFAVVGQTKINLNTLDEIRTKFVDIYFDKEHNKSYPNVLFDYQKKIKDAGHLEAYNHWILMKGNENEFENWVNKNKSEWDDFVEWFTKNPIKISDTNKFNSGQY